jgi:tetratricopeptide (TPR) repeat protein
MSDIFISYAREDRDKAERLARVFDQQGWPVWWDREILPGKKFANLIAKILPTAKAVVVLWSSNSVESDWVKDEAQEGAARGILVPVLVEEKIVPPIGFRQWQTADLSKWNGSPSDEELLGLLKSIAALLHDPQVEPPAVFTPETPTPRPKYWLYLLAGLVLLLGLGAIFLLPWGGPAPNQNNENGVSRNAVQDNSNRGAGDTSKTCDRESRQRAAELTSKGLTYIDPGGNHGAAVLQFNEAVAECPEYVEAYFYRGQSYAVLGRRERALNDFNKVRELSSDPETDLEAEKFIATLGGPAPTPAPTPRTTNANAANTSVPTNTNTTANTNATPGNTNTGRPTLDPVRVRDIFAADKSTRIAATTRLVIEKKRDPEAVRQAIRSALEHPENKSGVINTLVFLENVEPSILKQQRAEVEKLLAVARRNGEQTAEHVRKVEAILNG